MERGGIQAAKITEKEGIATWRPISNRRGALRTRCKRMSAIACTEMRNLDKNLSQKAFTHFQHYGNKTRQENNHARKTRACTVER